MRLPSVLLRRSPTVDLTLCLATDFCSGDHNPTSDEVALASCCVTGLYDRHWMASLCVYLRMPSACKGQESGPGPRNCYELRMPSSRAGWVLGCQQLDTQAPNPRARPFANTCNQKGSRPPSPPTLLVQMITVLSAPPEANRLPFCAYATQ